MSDRETGAGPGGFTRRRLLAALGSGVATASLLPRRSLAISARSGSATERSFNAHDYGARGDGRHDDAGAINRAIQAAASIGGGVVNLRAGTYSIGDRSIRLASRVALRGIGSDTVLLLASHVDASVITAASDGPEAPIVGSTIEQLCVDGNKANHGDGGDTYGINLWAANDCIVRRVRVANTVRSGIYLAGSRNTVTGCTVTGAGLSGAIGRSGIVFDTDGTNFPVNCLAQNNTVTNVREHGIKVYTGGDGSQIRWNFVQQAGDRGIYVQGSQRASVDGNAVWNSGSTGILIGDSSGAAADCVVSGNYVRDSASHGILVWGGRDSRIGAENYLEKNGGSGIYVLDCRAASVTRNRCVGNRGNGGIVFGGSPGGLIEGNECLGNNIAGIYISDQGGSSPGCLVRSNRCADDGWSQQRFGIYSRDSRSTLTVTSNDLDGNLVAEMIIIDPTRSNVR